MLASFFTSDVYDLTENHHYVMVFCKQDFIPGIVLDEVLWSKLLKYKLLNGSKFVGGIFS